MLPGVAREKTFARALLKVKGVRAAVKHHSPTCLRHPQAKIHVLKIFDEAFIKHSDRARRLDSHHHEAPGKPFALKGARGISVEVQVMRE